MLTDKGESDREMLGEEYFCKKVEEKVNELFFCPGENGRGTDDYLQAGGIRVFFAEKNWKTQSGWHIFENAGEEQKKSKMREGLERSFARGGMPEGNKLYGGRAKVLYICGEEKLRDSRISGKSVEGDYKTYKWIVLKAGEGTAEFSEVNRELVGIILNGIKRHFEDFLLLQMCEMGFSESAERYLFYGLQNGEDKDRIINRCVQRVLRKNRLPEKEILVQLSAQFYEKRSLNGRLCFSENVQLKSDRTDICFCEGDEEVYRKKRRLVPENLRTIRKLMETSGEKNALLVDTRDLSIAGLVELEKHSKEIYIEFSGHLKWRLKKDRDVLFQYQDGKYELLEMLRKEEYLEKIDCAKIEEKQREVVKNVVRELKGQSHGTAIIFFGYKEGEQNLALEEAKRLACFRRAHLIEEVHLMKCREKLLGITAIDGALLADFEGNCYAIGAILDGEAISAGDSGRGARFNSIKNYVEWIFKNKIEKPAVCMAVIFSEDETIDVIFKENS